ncbi:hypothetical protein GCM10010990_14700 [Croceicoccus mobilis]|uniref:Uncharacterized protein n=1 Tax=Croceicoccus mobilis TaxID=1703339 RepID=A0A916YX95_9SPHN|nr:hypothetical protein GCM10010990_14700 [Croceicoccus mobilis]
MRIDRAETVFIGDVIPQENGSVAGKGAVAQHFRDGRALIDAGNAKLDHIVSALDVKAMIIGHLLRQIMRSIPLARRATVMQRGAQWLVLKQQTLGTGGKFGKPLARAIEASWARAVLAFPAGKAPFRSMASGGSQSRHAEFIQHLECPAAYQRQTAIQSVGQFMKRCDEIVWYGDRIRAIRQFDQRAVEIEKQRVRSEIEQRGFWQLHTHSL